VFVHVASGSWRLVPLVAKLIELIVLDISGKGEQQGVDHAIKSIYQKYGK